MRKRVNPHLERLKKHQNWQKLNFLFNPDNIAIWVMLMIAVACFAMADAFFRPGVGYWIAFARVLVILIAPIPCLMAATAAVFATTDVQSGQLDLLRLSPLSSHQLLWGYLGASLFRFRYVLWIAFGSMTFTFACMIVIGVGSSFNYVGLDFLIIWAAYVMGYVGVVVAILIIMVTLALRLPQWIVIGIALPLVAFSGIFLSLTLSLLIVETRLSQAQNLTLAVRDGLLLAAIPYIIAGGSWVVALRWICYG